MKTSFTPGPWEIFPKSDTAKMNGIDAKGHSVVWIGPDCEGGIERDADAALIAAAPELYIIVERQQEIIDALDDLSTCYRIGKRPSEKTLDVLTEKNSVIEGANRTLAKARGE